MAVDIQRFRAVQGGRSRPQDAFWTPRPMSKLQRYLLRRQMHMWADDLQSLSGHAHQWWKRGLAWLTQPSEFVQLREADAVLRLLNPVVPERCATCEHYDWLNKERMCPACWSRAGAILKWLSVRQNREDAYGGS